MHMSSLFVGWSSSSSIFFSLFSTTSKSFCLVSRASNLGLVLLEVESASSLLPAALILYCHGWCSLGPLVYRKTLFSSTWSIAGQRVTDFDPNHTMAIETNPCPCSIESIFDLTNFRTHEFSLDDQIPIKARQVPTPYRSSSRIPIPSKRKHSSLPFLPK
jgi:hypothetical protein